MSSQIKNPDLPATQKQLYTLFKLSGKDHRNEGLTVQQASDKIGNLIAKKEQRKSTFESIWAKAWEAGQKAGNERVPVPMIVQEHTNPLDDTSPVQQEWNVPQGVCGFAWVNVKPGNVAFARFLKDKGIARSDSYEGGLRIWISDFGQSMEKKEACALAISKVLNEHAKELKIRALSGSRMD